LKDFVNRWASVFPYDVVWRKKYGIPFFSKQHKKSNFVDQVFEYIEERLIQQAQSEDQSRKKNRQWAPDEVPDNLTGGKMTQAEIEDEFDNFDINNPTGQ
jgi:hypothetical protein